MRLYVWHTFESDWTDGMAFAIADHEKEAKRIVVANYGDVYSWGDVRVYAIEKIGFGVCGSG